MPTESSAVSNLLHQLNTRRLRTDPGDDMLFQAPAEGRGRGRAGAQRGQVRWNAPAVAPAPAPLPAPAVAPRTAQAPVRSQAQAIAWPVAPARKTEAKRPRRRRTWPWIVATLVASVAGVVGASQLGLGDLDDDTSSAAFVVPTLPQPSPPAPVITATPVEPAATAPAAAPVAETAPAAEPAPAAEAAPAEPVAAKPAVHRSQKASHPKSKRVAKHVAKASHAAPAAAAPEPAEAAPPPPPPPPAPRGHQAQAADNENPL